MHPPLPGILYIIATPIGNLEDITKRAIRLLAEVDCIYAEDTRQTCKLLFSLGIKNNVISLHEHNEEQRCKELQDRLDKGDHIALVSDAGTPLISDPGYIIVRYLTEKNYTVTPIPGVSAIITALSVAGLATNRFTFEGFTPAKSRTRQNFLSLRENERATQVYYESCHRIVASIEDFIHIFGSNRRVVLARELTKLYEQYFRGTLKEALTWLSKDSNHQRGEFVIVLAGKPVKTAPDSAALDEGRLLKILASELPHKQAAKIAAALLDKSKNELYRRLIQLKK